jgi:hypothetical protein
MGYVFSSAIMYNFSLLNVDSQSFPSISNSFIQIFFWKVAYFLFSSKYNSSLYIFCISQIHFREVFVEKTSLAFSFGDVFSFNKS